MADNAKKLKQANLDLRNAKQSITKTETFLNTNANNLLHCYDYTNRLEMLERAYEKYCNAQDVIEDLETDETKIQLRDEIEERYVNCKSKLQIFIAQTQPRQNSTPAASVSVKSKSNLPEIKIEKFTGKPEDFASFYDIFNAVVLSDPDLSDAQKLIHLKTSLTGEPLKLIDGLQFIDSNLEVALDILKTRYENKLSTIYSHLKNLLEIPSVSKNSSLRQFITNVKLNTECLRNLGVPVEHWDLILVYCLSQKLDVSTRRAYEVERGPTKIPKLDGFLKFLETRCQAAENLSSPEVIKKSSHFAENSIFCNYCKMRNHNMYKCIKFKALTVAQRKHFVYSNRLCFKCFSNHSQNQCDWKNCPLCGESHNSLLHYSEINKNSNKNNFQKSNSQNTGNEKSEYKNVDQKAKQQNSNRPAESTAAQNSNSKPSFSKQSNPEQQVHGSVPKTCNFIDQKSHILLATANVSLINNSGNMIQARAVIDSGSQVSLITHRLAKKLNYPTYKQNVLISGVSGSMQCSESIDIDMVSNIDKNKRFKVNCSVTNMISSKLPQCPIDYKQLDIPESIVLADASYYTPNQVDLLLGADIAFSIILPGLIKLGDNLPVLQNTCLGWILGGPLPSTLISHFNFRDNDQESRVSFFTSTRHIDELMQKFWCLEEVPNKEILSTEDELSEKIFKSTTKVLENGRFQVDIPLKSENEHQKLGESFSFAKRRFLSLEKKLHQNSELLEQYSEFIDEYVNLGHARYIPLDLKTEDNDHKYFIPHHCIIRNDKTTSRLRVVYDASMKTTSNYSLNDICLKGMVVQPELFDILCRFRSCLYAVVADISKMYRQVLINPKQTFLQNILWRKNPEEDIKCIELLTVSYGTNFAPYVATRCLLELSDKYENKYPLAANAIKSQTYMDDILTGTNCSDELLRLKDELIKLLGIGKFELHKWCSNSEEFMRSISEEEELHKYNIKSENNSNKILGVSWNPKLDSFSISSPKDLCINGPITKRNVLSVISQIFDPLGLVGPIVVNAKIFMQQLWCKKLNWDEMLDESLKNIWLSFSKDLSKLCDLKIPRCIRNKAEIKKIELHGYSDASLKAYGCCVYLRVIYQDESVSCHLICAKSRVSPIRTVSLPRLELCGCLLLSQLVYRLFDIYKNVFKIESVNLWSDSQVCLAWIQSHPSDLNIFVSNRIAMIQEKTANYVWRYIPSKMNPADHLSRGLTAEELIKSKLWWNGPEHLQNIELDLNTFNFSSNLKDLPEKKKVKLMSLSVTVKENPMLQVFDKFSDFTKLQRVIAFCLRFHYNSQVEKKDRICGTLKVHELDKALDVIIKILQKHYFSHEIDLLLTNKVLPNKKLQSLSPFVDQSGIIRVGGRLSNADIPFSQKYPILLPSKCHVVKLLLRREHLKLYHAGPQTVLTSVLLRFWPLDGLRTIKSIIHNCVSCFRFKAKSAEQIMADLPKDRVSISRPFLKVGVDYAGPVFLKVSNLRRAPKIKAYISIFVCMAIKCVHIELVSSLSTESFLMTLKRFIARRGNPAVIYSDNASNFLGSSNQLKELYEFFKNQNNVASIETFLSNNETQWKFIPPRSPHWGGLWEAAVKSAKHHIIRSIGDTALTFEELSTVLASVEAIMNSRPLTALSNDPSDMNPLTPGHFLIGDSLSAFPDKSCCEIPDNRLTIYQKILKIRELFWRRWTQEYLNRLQKRPKWLAPSQNLKLDQIVLLKEDNLPPLKWALARIIEIIQSADGKIRSVKVKTQDGIYLRSISKLCPLPENDF